ncbi:MAG: hypothetical protein ACYDD5_00535 [Sulfuricurvum sp.]
MTLTSVNQRIAMLQELIAKEQQEHKGKEDVSYKYWHGHTLGSAEGQLKVYEYIRNELEEGVLVSKHPKES